MHSQRSERRPRQGPAPAKAAAKGVGVGVRVTQDSWAARTTSLPQPRPRLRLRLPLEDMAVAGMAAVRNAVAVAAAAVVVLHLLTLTLVPLTLTRGGKEQSEAAGGLPSQRPRLSCLQKCTRRDGIQVGVRRAIATAARSNVRNRCRCQMRKAVSESWAGSLKVSRSRPRQTGQGTCTR